MTCACESIHKFPCQFPGETEFFHITPHDDRKWCRFHLPMLDDKGNSSEKVRWEEGNGDRETFEKKIFLLLDAASPWDETGDGRADFRGVVFPERFDFTKFGKPFHVNFSHASLGTGAKFKGVRFSEAFFNNAKFGMMANFTEATFDDWPVFTEADFGFNAIFSDAKFRTPAHFTRATFGEAAIFSDTTFESSAFFSDTTFGGRTKFDNAEFHWIADFQAYDPAFSFSDIDFSGSKFLGPSTFTNRTFGNGVNFNGAEFRDIVEFHGCAFHPGMSFYQTKFLKTKGRFDGETEELERSYRTLKLEMEKLRARNEEADFFALEMECRRQRGSVPPFERFAATLYKHLSDYGRSIVRPLVWLLPLTVFSFLIYRDLGAIHAAEFRDESEILEFTLEQMFSPFKVWFSPSEGEGDLKAEKDGAEKSKSVKYKAVPDLLSNYPPLVKILASLQSLAAIALLTLFLLALRRRFKMD